MFLKLPFFEILFLESAYPEIQLLFCYNSKSSGSSHNKVPKVLDCEITVSWNSSRAIYVQLSDKYPWEKYEAPDHPSYGLNSTRGVSECSWMNGQRRDLIFSIFLPASDCLEAPLCLFWSEDHTKSCVCENLRDRKKGRRTLRVRSETPE